MLSKNAFLWRAHRILTSDQQLKIILCITMRVSTGKRGQGRTGRSIAVADPGFPVGGGGGPGPLTWGVDL